MNSVLQLITLIFSVLYGVIFYLLTVVNFNIVKGLKNIYANIITFIFTLDMTVIYSILIYKLNNGYFHIYFIILVMLGFALGYIKRIERLFKNLSKINVKINKRT